MTGVTFPATISSLIKVRSALIGLAKNVTIFLLSKRDSTIAAIKRPMTLPLVAIRYSVAAILIGLGIFCLARHWHPRWIRMYETKPADVQVKVLRAQWTEASSYRAVSSWLRLSTSHQNRIDLIAGQDDGMALGARKAFQELPDNAARQRWLSLPFIGCDGLPKTGQAWVKRGLLTATIFAGPNTGQALEMLVKALQTGTMPPENTLTTPLSIPTLDALAASQAERARLLSV